MPTPIRQVKGIGLYTEKTLVDAGFSSVESLAEMTIEQLVSVPGFGPKRAEKVIEYARQLIADFSSEEIEQEPVAPSDVAEKKEKKKKTAQKGKKGKKGTPKNKKEKKGKKEKSQKGKEKKGKQKKEQEKKKGKKKKKK